MHLFPYQSNGCPLFHHDNSYQKQTTHFVEKSVKTEFPIDSIVSKNNCWISMTNICKLIKHLIHIFSHINIEEQNSFTFFNQVF